MNETHKFHYSCINCNKTYGSREIIYLCPDCEKLNVPGKPPKGVLKVLYDYEAIRNRISGFDDLRRNNFLDILPLSSTDSLPKLRIGNTPLYRIGELDGQTLPFSLMLKDDSQNPTFSFKDRASALVSAFGRERGITTIVAASTGNAGSSLAGICAAQAQKAIIMVPETAPIAKLTQIVMYGATIIPVKGTYDDAFDLSVAATRKFGWYNRNTAYNPLTVEGKKTVSLEIFEQCEFRVPDKIFVSVGDGVIISGIYKGFEDLLELGLISKMPVVIGVQAEGSSNLALNLNQPEYRIREGKTIADSISVDVPRNFFMTQYFINKYRGELISVCDGAILSAASKLSAQSGIFTEPASAAAFAGFLHHFQHQKIPTKSTNLVLLTGSGLKDIKAFAGCVSIPQAVAPSIENLEKFITA